MSGIIVNKILRGYFALTKIMHKSARHNSHSANNDFPFCGDASSLDKTLL